jgi:hypothetical protein
MPAGEGLLQLHCTEAELAMRRKGDRAKGKVAMKLRTQTTKTRQWILAGPQLGMGSSLSNHLPARRRGQRQCENAGRTPARRCGAYWVPMGILK